MEASRMATSTVTLQEDLAATRTAESPTKQVGCELCAFTASHPPAPPDGWHQRLRVESRQCHDRDAGLVRQLTLPALWLQVHHITRFFTFDNIIDERARSRGRPNRSPLVCVPRPSRLPSARCRLGRMQRPGLRRTFEPQLPPQPAEVVGRTLRPRRAGFGVLHLLQEIDQARPQ